MGGRRGGQTPAGGEPRVGTQDPQDPLQPSPLLARPGKPGVDGHVTQRTRRSPLRLGKGPDRRHVITACPHRRHVTSPNRPATARPRRHHVTSKRRPRCPTPSHPIITACPHPRHITSPNRPATATARPPRPRHHHAHVTRPLCTSFIVFFCISYM
ncbi:hypothetical protein FPV67DRAFT_276437 [Lyophyllum atratum]|nr:hypothetical protein FPV67DRAFT_276437 [Lyophyllum atratum]